MSAPPRIEAAGLADLPALVELLGLLFAQEAEFRPDPAAAQRGLAQILATPALGRLLLARGADGQVLGMVNLLFSVSTALGAPVAWLEDVIVRPGHRGQGLGRQLVEAAQAAARAHGCRRITLLTDGDNLRAQAFYAGLGFHGSPMRPMRCLLD